MLLVHACRVMNMSINLPDIVEVPVWCSFLGKQLSIGIDHQMKIKFLKLQKHENRGQCTE